MNEETKQLAVEILENCRNKGLKPEEFLEFIMLNESNPEQSLERRVSKLLKELGIPAKLLGYGYLRYAIIFIMEHPEKMRSVTRGLYPAIANEFNTTDARVERAIRHAIEVAWDRGNPKLLEEVFGNTINPKMGRATNTEFLAIVTDYLKF